MPPDATRSRFAIFMDEIRLKRLERREAPQPYVLRKLMIVVVLAITAYAVYVYIGRLCVTMVKQKPGAMGSRGQGGKFSVANFHPVAIHCSSSRLYNYIQLSLSYVHVGIHQNNSHTSRFCGRC